MNPKVHTENSTFEPDHLYKKDWGIVMEFVENREVTRVSIPWNRIQEVREVKGFAGEV